MEAYAKLVDRNSLENEADTEKREFLITELPCSLGRTSMQSSEHYSIVIDSTDVLLSRQHAQIKWSQDDGWTLTCLSKNGLFVDERKYRKNDRANLQDGNNIRLGMQYFSTIKKIGSH
jgi:pSer/pThr/pTyr-binding forkhead associated (FHA) protein